MLQMLFCLWLFCNFFGIVNFPHVTEFVEKGLFDFSLKSSRTEDQFTTISDLQNNEERASFHPGNRKLI